MRRIVFIALLFSFIEANGQDNRLGVAVSPAILNLTSNRIAVQAGGEYGFKQRWSILTDFVLGLKKDPPANVSDEKFFRLKPELRYFLSDRKAYSHAYLGLQLSYSGRSWKDRDGSYFEEKLYEDSAITYQSASVKSPVFTASIQGGTVIPIGENFGLDFFAGFGVRIINTTYSNVQGTGKTYALRPICKVMFSPDPAWLVNGTVTRPHFNMGFRLIYRF
jgi:Protein of unknown function (DUF3575)